MKQTPVLKLEPTGRYKDGEKVYHLMFNGKILRRNFAYSDDEGYITSDDNGSVKHQLSYKLISEVPCADYPENMLFDVVIDNGIFDNYTHNLDFIREKNKIRFGYAFGFNVGGNKLFVWNPVRFAQLLFANIKKPGYKVFTDIDPRDFWEVVNLHFDRTVSCKGTFGEVIEQDLNHLIQALEKTITQLNNEAALLKDYKGLGKP